MELDISTTKGKIVSVKKYIYFTAILISNYIDTKIYVRIKKPFVLSVVKL